MIQAITEPAIRDSKDFLVRIAVTMIKTIGISVSAPYSIAVYLITNTAGSSRQAAKNRI
jgi:hypothetical protein